MEDKPLLFGLSLTQTYRAVRIVENALIKRRKNCLLECLNIKKNNDVSLVHEEAQAEEAGR